MVPLAPIIKKGGKYSEKPEEKIFNRSKKDLIPSSSRMYTLVLKGELELGGKGRKTDCLKAGRRDRLGAFGEEDLGRSHLCSSLICHWCRCV